MANKASATKEWYIIDAEEAVLGRLASEAAKIIRGKYKPSFTPHVDAGDNVIVINAEKVRLTGNKWDDKQYVRHTGYPGGQRFTSAREMRAKNPGKVIEEAVRGMLPKSRLGRKIFHNMFIYSGPEHPHQAQQPKEFKL